MKRSSQPASAHSAAHSAAQAWKRWAGPKSSDRPESLRQAIALLSKLPSHREALEEQPFDGALLKLSPLYRRSRELFLECGGSFRPALLSSPRTLSSLSLLESRVEYSPLQSEYVWQATDRLQTQGKAWKIELLRLRAHVACVFHEQNHRILWKRLPPAPSSVSGLGRYLNFAESLVIALDMALSDGLGEVSELFYRVGAVYDPGTGVRAELNGRRAYRNYLHAVRHATWLGLEHYEPRDIPRVIEALFPMLGPLARRAADRALRLDARFIAQTNPDWQARHHREAIKRLGARRGQKAFDLPDSGTDLRLAYVSAERFFEEMGL